MESLYNHLSDHDRATFWRHLETAMRSRKSEHAAAKEKAFFAFLDELSGRYGVVFETTDSKGA